MQNVNSEVAILNAANSAASLILTGRASDCSLSHIAALQKGFDLAAGKVKHYAQAACYAAIVVRCNSGEQAVDALKARQGLGAQIAKALSSANGLIKAGISADQLIGVLEKLRDSGKFSAVQQSTTAAIAAIQKAGLWKFETAEGEQGEQGKQGEQGEQGEQGASSQKLAASEPDRVALLAIELVGGMSVASFVMLTQAVADRLAGDKAAQAAIHAAGVEREKAAQAAQAAQAAKAEKEKAQAAQREKEAALQALLLASNQADVTAQTAAQNAKQYGKKRTKAAQEARKHAAEMHAAAVAAGKAYLEAATA